MRGRLGKYELVTLMSVGGMAELYLAAMAGPGGFRKAVAVKQMLPEFRDDPVFVQRFLDEARITAALSHPHLAQVFDLGETDGELYLAMEFIAGVDLSRVARGGGDARLPPGFVTRVARDIALALASAHALTDAAGESKGLVHRDLNPRNVMLTFEGVVKVVDFGLARFRGRRVKTAVGTVRGTPQYMAPEQLLDEPLDARTDLYGLGVVMWELLAGRFFAEPGVQDVEARLRRGEPAPRVRSVNPEVSAELDELIAHCLATRQEDRFGSARELARALERCGEELFDEEKMSQLLSERLPQTKGALRRLVALAENPDTTEEAIGAELRGLRKADLRQGSRAPLATPATPSAAPPVVALPEPEIPAPQPPVGPHLGSMLMVSAVALLLVGGLTALFVSSGEPDFTAQSVGRGQTTLMQRARQVLAAGDPLRAREIAVGCVGPRGPCAGLDTLVGEIDAVLSRSACGTDAQANAVIAQARELAAEPAGARLRECVAGKKLHPLALRELERMQLQLEP